MISYFTVRSICKYLNFVQTSMCLKGLADITNSNDFIIIEQSPRDHYPYQK